MKPVRVGLMLATVEDLREAALPLFEAGEVDAVEWSLDLVWNGAPIPDWCSALLDAYGDAGRLYAHGVQLSLLSAEWNEWHERWLENAAHDCARWPFVHFSEHYGWMTGGAFTDGTPLPCPYDAAAVTLGQERLARLRDTVERDVGLENLAFAFSREDCEVQPRFVEELLAPVDGFLLLDVHNLYCQADNYGFDPVELMERYPLHRVRELHVAGGQLTHPASDPAGRSFRRDGHDRPVPDGAFALVEAALSRCPDLEVIILEHADHTLSTASALDRFATDFRHLRRLVADAGRALPADDV